ncbi:hypothetical protein HJC23_001553 [Cyclotella cryptica]|uniref:DUF2237 domain-containing protein n=1 Tax=Cyclotella cryptica TaxID=29204 RepID=A0ABD3Q2E6_9STRA|eukprot:CCRYP_010773-RA/>CCRYP_010773-RA protein AED:0.11 eAED:-0.13 QI:0/-1/0/1/-1/1/1/0/216
MKGKNSLLPAIALANSALGAYAWSPSPPSTAQKHYTNRLFDSILKAQHDNEDPIETKYSGYNVLGTELTCCCSNVGGSGIGTGFYRNGYCSTGEMDLGRHTVCVRVTDDFLAFSKSVGNDLSTPMPQYNFPGLKDGDVWCLCAQRWAQAYNAGKAPQLFLQATHEKTLDYVPLEVLRVFAIDGQEASTVIDKLKMQRSQLDELMNLGQSEDSASFQ